jgi:hypothetical protein
VVRDGDEWIWNGRRFSSLSACAAAIRNRPRANGPRFFGYPMTGNAMDALCREIGLDGSDAHFLGRNYDRAVNEWGYFNA